jgi:hypothetical protein
MCCVRWCRSIALLSVVFLFSTCFLSTCFAQTEPAAVVAPPMTDADTPEKPTARNTYPEIVRVLAVEGDVRMSRGEDGEKASGAAWQTAAANAPIESGYNLVTGNGRAVIEFEDASTAYVAENSVVRFATLVTVAGVPHTVLELLSGSMAVHGLPMVAGQVFAVRTLRAGLRMKYPHPLFVRVDAYLDGMTVTSLAPGKRLHFAGKLLRENESFVFRDGRWRTVPNDGTQQEFAAFDSWVTSSVAARDASLLSVMRSTGMNRPVPGMAELDGEGTFFSCEPYGTCWVPKDGWKTPPTPTQEEDDGGAAPAGVRVDANAAQAGRAQVRYATEVDTEDAFPCAPYLYRTWYQRDLWDGSRKMLYMEEVGDPYYYDWAVCHTGTWVRFHHRYAWVPGKKRHHHCPVRWVSIGKHKAYVPLHPRDVAGKRPVNIKHAVFDIHGRNGETGRPVRFDANAPVKVLRDPPKDARSGHMMMLAKAEAPHMEAHMFAGSQMPGRPGEAARPVSVSLTFDHKAQGFMMSRQVMDGWHMRTVSEPMGGHAGYGGGGEHGGFGGGSFGGGGSSHGFSGGSSGGGGSHGFGGGSSGGGGGSHGGGGGGGFSGGGGGSSSGGSSSGGSSSGGGGGHR